MAPLASRADDAWIQSDGKQVLNTGYCVKPTTKIVVDFAFTDAALTGSGRRLFGVYHKGITAALGVHNGNLYYEIGFGASSSWTSLGVAADTARHIATLDCGAGTLDVKTDDVTATYKLNADVGSATATAPLAIFSTTTGSTPSVDSFVTPAKIYSFKIYEGAELVRNYVPAVRGGLAGLYDEVTQVFLSPYDLTGSVPDADNQFTASDDLRERDAGYVAAAGDAMVNTGYYVKPTTKIVIDYAYDEVGNDKRIMGVFNAGSTLGIYQVKTDPYQARVEKGDGTSNINGTLGFSGGTRRHTWVVDCNHNSQSAFITGVTTNWSGNAGKAISVDATAPLSLFTTTVGGSPSTSYRASGRIYRVSIYEENEETGKDAMVHDWIPFVKDEVAGFRDAANGDEFLAPSSGALSYGGDIDGSLDAYIASDGTQMVNTGYKIKPETKIIVDYQFVSWSNGNRLFGVYHGGATVGLYPQGSVMRMEIGGSNNKDKATDFSLAPDATRHTAVVYCNNETPSSFATGETVVSKTLDLSGTAVNAEATAPLSIFTTATGGAPAAAYRATARIYSFIIYEGDDIVHEYLPYKKGDVVGFYDTKAATEAERVLTDVNGGSFAIGGKGVGGAERWLVKPEDRKLTKGRGGCTLSASAAGAVSYRWTRDGEAIDGGEDGDLAVEWEKRGDAVYAAIPVYELYGRKVEGEPVSATVTHVPAGTVVIIR